MRRLMNVQGYLKLTFFTVGVFSNSLVGMFACLLISALLVAIHEKTLPSIFERIRELAAYGGLPS